MTKANSRICSFCQQPSPETKDCTLEKINGDELTNHTAIHIFIVQALSNLSRELFDQILASAQNNNGNYDVQLIVNNIPVPVYPALAHFLNQLEQVTESRANEILQ